MWRHGRTTVLLGWLALLLAGGLLLVRADIAQRRDAFQAEARTAHRLLSQRAVQHEAILATLALLGPSATGAEQRLPALHPQLLQVLRRDGDQAWPDAALRQAEARSRSSGQPALVGVDAAAGRYTLLQAGDPASFAMLIDAQRMVPWDAWPVQRGGPVRVSLVHGDQVLVLQPGAETSAQPLGLTAGFVFSKALATAGQPFDLQLRRATGPAEWPWTLLLAWAVCSALAVGGVATWRRAQQGRQRAESLLRLGQVARLNAMGEMAAGVAHELNQPLAAVMANTQAARRLLDDDEPDLATARHAIVQATEQARRAADVVARLRRRVEAPDSGAATQAVPLHGVARQVLDLLEPETRRRGVQATLEGPATTVQADPVALEQIVHNLVNNALLALDEVPARERQLLLAVGTEAAQGVLTVRDSGPGIAPELLPRLFEPFFTTRSQGLGLGLSLCETLAQAMHGTLRAANARPRGAEFRLALPLAPQAAA